MITDIDFLILFFDKMTSKSNKREMKEQDAASTGTAPTGGGGGGKTPPKWADTVGGPQRGKANMLGKSGEKWQTGMNRGVSNQIW